MNIVLTDTPMDANWRHTGAHQPLPILSHLRMPVATEMYFLHVVITITLYFS